MTDFLYTSPSFLLGAARVVDLGATLDSYNNSPTPEIADARATLADWKAVGADIAAAASAAAERTDDATESD